MEIYEFRMNYQGPPYHPVERFLWGTLCRDYDCPMGYEAFCHEIGEACLLDPKEVWNLSPIDIILKPDAAKAYREAVRVLLQRKMSVTIILYAPFWKRRVSNKSAF